MLKGDGAEKTGDLARGGSRVHDQRRPGRLAGASEPLLPQPVLGHDPQRAGRARRPRLPDPAAHLGREGAHRLRLPVFRRLPDGPRADPGPGDRLHRRRASRRAGGRAGVGGADRDDGRGRDSERFGGKRAAGNARPDQTRRPRLSRAQGSSPDPAPRRQPAPTAGGRHGASRDPGPADQAGLEAQRVPCRQGERRGAAQLRDSAARHREGTWRRALAPEPGLGRPASRRRPPGGLAPARPRRG